MNDETSKAEQPKQGDEEALTDQELDQVAGGTFVNTPTKTTQTSGTQRSGQMADVNFGGNGT